LVPLDADEVSRLNRVSRIPSSDPSMHGPLMIEFSSSPQFLTVPLSSHLFSSTEVSLSSFLFLLTFFPPTPSLFLLIVPLNGGVPVSDRGPYWSFWHPVPSPPPFRASMNRSTRLSPSSLSPSFTSSCTLQVYSLSRRLLLTQHLHYSLK